MGIQFESRLQFKMKAIIAFSAIIVAVSAQSGCDECKKGVDALVANLLLDKSLNLQLSLLNNLLCPMTEDPAGCVKGLNAHWKDVAKAVYPVFLESGAVCTDLGACGAKSFLAASATCEDCTNDLNGIAGLAVKRENVFEVISFLKGDGLCATSSDPAYCGQVVEKTMPFALPALAEVLALQGPAFCCSLSSEGLCC